MPTFESTLSHFHLEVDGKALSDTDKADVLDILVENSLYLPDMFAIRIADPHFTWIDRDVFKHGAEVTLYAGYDTSRSLERICHGEVTAVEMDLNATATPSVLVRGYDRSHRLQKGRMSRSFLSMKDSDIVKSVAREVGLKCEVQSSEQQHEYVFQNNQTNWEFLQERARRIGFECFVAVDGKLYFRPSENGKAKEVEIEWGLNLRSYRPRITAARQVSEVVVRGWDPKRKKEIVGKAKKPTGTPKVKDPKQGPDVAREVFGAPQMVVVDRPVHSQQEADAMAKSICEELAQDYLTADGVVYGEPKLRSGVMVSVKNLGKKLSGKYYVTSSTHTWTPDEGYMTAFAVGGKSPQTIMDLLGSGAGGGDRSGVSTLNPAGGNIVVGVVTNNVDPEGLGRVKVKFPWLVEGHDSHWARLSTPMAGPGRGFYWIPELDDEVLLAFEHGDMHRPYVIGCLWNGKDQPMQRNDNCVKGGKVNRRLIKTRYGHELEFNDTASGEHIILNTAGQHKVVLNDSPTKNVTIETTYGHKVFLDDDAKAIVVTTPGGHSFSMEDTGMKIQAQTTSGHVINMDDAGSSITISDNVGDTIMMSMGMVNITALLMMSLTAPVININAAMSMNASAGMDMGLSSGGSMDLSSVGDLHAEAEALATFKGTGGTNVLSSAIINVLGSLVKINC